MARRLRVQYAGAVYHVTARGNERREIFRDERDRQRFLDALQDAAVRFGLRLHAYCLMPNHYHLLLGTPRANLSQAMGWFQTTVTTRSNARHRRRGIAVARDCGYADSSGVTQVIKRLEARAATDRLLADRLRQLQKLSKVND